MPPQWPVSGLTHVTDAFPITRGTRQGCLLSPLLFALAMEPLAIRIRSSPLNRGLPIGTLEEHIFLCTDDTLVYLADIQDSLKDILSEINAFGDFLFPLDQAAVPLIHPDSRLQVAPSFRYLGIVVHPLSSYINTNLCPVLSQLQLQT